MLCTNCKKENASFFFSQTINGVKNSVALCKNCSAKLSNSSVGAGIFEPFYMTNQSSPYQNQNKKCSLCGLEFADIKKLGKVGCSECYNSFSSELNEIIKQIHGNAKHQGRPPDAKPDIQNPSKSDEEVLREELNQAIISENYEEAAIIRDKIKALKGD